MLRQLSELRLSENVKLEKEIERFDKKFEMVMAELEEQDQMRNLFTLDDKPASLMDYPSFAGKDQQCYFQYEEKMTRALKVNKVPMVDQVAKIRASLSGHPLNLVPESMKLAKDAFQALRDRYGDEDRVLRLRVKELKKCGKRPEAHMAQVSWYTDLISKMQRLLELGEKSDDLAALAFGEGVFSAILNLFPSAELYKMGTRSAESGKRTKQRMEYLIKVLGEKRERANYLDKHEVKDKPPPGGGGSRGGQSCIFCGRAPGNEFEPLAYVGNILIQNGRFYLNYFRFGYYLKYCSLELMRNLIIG